MRGILAALLASGMAWGQAAETPKPAAPEGQAAPITQPGSAAQVQAIAPAGASAAASDPNATVIPAGTKLPLVLKQAISTKNAKEGDAVYAETSFPFVVNDRVLVPAGTYVQGKIMHSERAGRSPKRAASWSRA